MFDKQKLKGYYTNMNKLESFKQQFEEIQGKIEKHQSLLRQQEAWKDHLYFFKQPTNLYLSRAGGDKLTLPPGLPFIEDWILAYIQEKLEDVNLQIKEYEEEV